MDITVEQLTQRYIQFTSASLTWCARESELATSRVTDAIELLLKNTQRVSQISEESIEALQGLRRSISLQLTDDKEKRLPLGQLIKSLQVLASEHSEVDAVIHPIINSLQFQDRMRQNFENMVQMLPVWLAFRSGSGDLISPLEMQEFGEKLMKFTTMAAERDIVRGLIPGLPPEAAVAAVMMF